MRLSLRRSAGLAAHVLLALALGGVLHPAAAQHAETEPRAEVAGSVSLTNKGVSLIPSFTLGKPAATFDVAIRKTELSFEPQFRFGLDGKPWSFIFWWRHRPLSGDKLRLTIGAHPAVSTDDGRADVTVAARYLAGEVAPSYSLTKNVSVGAYYLFAYGVEKAAVKHTQFVASRASLTNIRISDQYSLQVAPQLFYLRMDGRDGWYLNSGLTVVRRNVPVSISVTLNKPIRTRIPAGEGFLWNLSVNYSFE